jgi:hypothetical protein
MNKGVLGILLVAFLGLGVYAIGLKRENSRLRADVEGLRMKSAVGEKSLIGAVGSGSGAAARPGALEHEGDGAKEESPPEAGLGEDMQVAAVEAGKEQAGMMKNFAKMMEEPGMRAMIEQQQGIMIDGMFGPLFKELGLDEEQTDALRAMMLERQMAATEIGMKMMDSDLSKEARQELAEGLQEEKDRANEAIKEMLGDEGYAEFELFEKSQPERQVLQTYRQSLKDKGLQLSLDQEEQLMSAMYEERTNFKYSNGDFGDKSRVDPDIMENFTPGKVDAYMAEYRQLQSQIAGRAESILDEAQLQEFQASQEAMVNMQEMGMRMGLGMMGRGGEEEGK